MQRADVKDVVTAPVHKGKVAQASSARHGLPANDWH